MTAHVHDPATHGGGVPATNRGVATSTGPTRPRWLVPGLLIALLVGGLVVAGVVSISTVLYAGLLGGMILLHMGGHGHGGHSHGDHGGGVASGHTGHSSGTSEAADLSRGSSGSQPPDSRSVAGPDERAANESTTSETEHHDQHSSHGCH